MLGIVGILSGFVLGAWSGIQDIQTPPDFGSVIGQLAQQFTVLATRILGMVNSTLVDISRVAYVSAVLLGILLYSTHLERRLGRDLIKGGIVLAVLSEFIFPVIARV